MANGKPGRTRIYANNAAGQKARRDRLKAANGVRYKNYLASAAERAQSYRDKIREDTIRYPIYLSKARARSRRNRKKGATCVTFWTPQNINRLETMLQQNQLSTVQMATELGITRSSVRNKIFQLRHTQPRPRVKPKTPLQERVLELDKLGVTPIQIAKELNVTKNVVVGIQYRERQQTGPSSTMDTRLTALHAKMDAILNISATDPHSS